KLPQFSFQVRLHANNDVDFVFGPSSNLGSGDSSCNGAAVGNCNYVSGLQSNLFFGGQRPALLDYATSSLSTCGSSNECAQNQFPPANTSVTFKDVFRSVGPDLQVTGINPPDLIPQGGTVSIPVTLSNGGGTASSGQGQIQFYFSAGSNQPQGSPFALQNVVAMPACNTQPFNAQVALPAGVPQGGGYLIAEFIPGAESVDQNHTFASAPVIVGPPEPDLAVVGSLSFSPPNIVGGQNVDLSFTAQNVGEVPAGATAYGIYVSLGGTISSGDIQIGGGLLPALNPGDTQTVNLSVSIPLTLVSGDYLIGVMLNPGGTLKEVNQTNNVAIGNKLVAVTSPD